MQVTQGRARERLSRLVRRKRRVLAEAGERTAGDGGCICEVCGVRVTGGDMRLHCTGRQHRRMERRRMGRDVRGWEGRERTLLRKQWRGWRSLRGVRTGEDGQS